MFWWCLLCMINGDSDGDVLTSSPMLTSFFALSTSTENASTTPSILSSCSFTWIMMMIINYPWLSHKSCWNHLIIIIIHNIIYINIYYNIYKYILYYEYILRNDLAPMQERHLFWENYLWSVVFAPLCFWFMNQFATRVSPLILINLIFF